ncbi:AEC family transporter [Natronogracilivirga saccharolytica]|uniref:AEC family transporter n=1 Tax=Natronogracilivirga saccharolytica TaxID=2812953 RepID=A0A8J7RT09_9BACT|nr:AEC family transporter [Natronogracilivirga saccharolytica]MBP3193274.1 AEC family transporter [Natronogracilivirga saccharolytica]
MDPLAPAFLLIASLLIGVILQFVKAFPDNSYLVLNQYVIYVALPAVGLIHIPEIEIQTDLLYPVASAWIIFFMAIVLINMAGRWLSWSRQTIGCIILTGGLGNTLFIGYPVAETLFGQEGLSMALLMDQSGSFVIVSTIGIAVAGIYAAGKTKKRALLRQVVTFPPFIVFILAIIMNIAGVTTGGIVLDVLDVFATTLAPVALISVGMQLKFRQRGYDLQPMSVGLIYKLLIAPAILFVIYVLITGGEGVAVQASIIQAATPPNITGSILATTYGLNPRLASQMVSVGIPVSVLTMAFWYVIIA